MNPPVTGREALLIEAIAELVDVLDRVDLLLPALEAGQIDAAAAHRKLAVQVSKLEAQMVATGETVKTNAVKFIAQHTGQATRQSIDLHIGAMEEAARKLFVAELSPALRALVAPLLQVQEIVRQQARPWDHWLTHAATAIVASLCTWVVMSGVWR
ncbi:hypothetical protein [Roseateles sp.]|uniref:hypothetical protein n=1 Tax=Roseateles sp. TaxID=1971397 RepID=UPI0032673C0D